MTAQISPSNTLIAVTTPFGFARETHEIAWQNLTIAEMFARSNIEIPRGCTARVFLGDWLIPQELWHRVRPKPHHTLTCRVVPKGGGDKKKNIWGIIAAVILTIIVAVVTWGVGAALAPAIGASLAGIAGSAAGAVTGIVGSLLIKALIPPPKQNLGTTGGAIGSGPQQYTLTGTRNQASPYGVIPKIYGRMRIFPLYGGQPYSEIVGFDQYLRMLFVVGYGPLQLSELKIGDTPISEFDGVEYQIRQGYEDDPDLEIYTQDVDPEFFNLRLLYDDGWVIRTSKIDADEIGVEISFPAGLYTWWEEDGKPATYDVNFQIEYSPTGQNDWAPCEWIDNPLALEEQQPGDNQATPEPYLHPWGIDGYAYFIGAHPGAKRYANRFQPAQGRGQYDIRFKRLITDPGEGSAKPIGPSFLSSITTVTYRPPITQTNICTVAMRVKASGQLNGALDSFNCIAEAILPVYDSGSSPTWNDAVTRSPAWALTDLLKGYANQKRVTDDRINLTEIEAWADYCATRDWKFDMVFDSRTTVWDVAQLICSAGRASFTPSRDGKYSIVHDRVQSTIVQHFTPRNSWGYTGHMGYGRRAHAFKVRFLNPDTNWQTDERIVYADGYDESNATEFEALELPGKTDPDEIYTFARYFMAQASLRPETHTFSADIENLVCTRGDLIRFSHDVPMLGLGAGRVKTVTVDGSGNAVSVTLDAAVTMISGVDYCCRFRRTADNGSVLANVVSSLGEVTSLTFETPIASAEKPAAGDLFMFGEVDNETIELVVSRITPRADLSAEIECVNAAPEIHALDDGAAIPAWSSNISVTLQAPTPPEIATTLSDDSAVRNLPGGSSEFGLIVYLVPPSGLPPMPVHYEYQFRPSGAGWGETFRTSGVTHQIRMAPIVDSALYDYRVRAISGAGIASAWTTVTGHPIAAFTSQPDDVANFRTAYIADQLQLVWDTVTDFRFIDYEIRKGPTAETASVVGIAHGVNAMLALGDDTYWIAARANPVPGVIVYSETWATLVLTGSMLSSNVIASWDEAALSWLGDLAGDLAIEGANVVNAGSGDFFAIEDFFSVTDLFGYGGYGSGTYTIPDAHIIDVGRVAPCPVIITFTGFGITPGGDYLATEDVLAVVDVLGNAAGGSVDIYPEIAVAQADEVYADWVKYVPGVYVGQFFKARMHIESVTAEVQAALSEFTFTVDVPDRHEDGTVTLGTGATAVTYADGAFNGATNGGNGSIPNPQVTIVNSSEGDTLLLTSITATGFTAQVKNAGAGVARDINYRASGW